MTRSSMSWADQDGDGDLDLMLAGYNEPMGVVALFTTLYRAQAGANLVEQDFPLAGLSDGDVAWGDCDGDGDPDVLVTGSNRTQDLTRLYRNDGSSFPEISTNLPNLYWSAIAWGDYDGDSDQDLALTGGLASSLISRVYRNEGGGSFVDIQAGLEPVVLGAVSWGDFDGDSDLDLLLTGETNPSGPDAPISKIYRNDGSGSFVDIAAALEGVSHSVADWADYDGDDDLDILLAGYPLTGGLYAGLFRNDSGVFVNAGVTLEATGNGGGGWGDYDDDGDPDILLSGENFSGPKTTWVYRNDGGAFVDMLVTIPGINYGDATWGDVDRDGDLDIHITGEVGPGGEEWVSTLYRNDGGTYVKRLDLWPLYLSAADMADYNGDGRDDLIVCGQGLPYEFLIATRLYRNEGSGFINVPNGIPGLDQADLEWGDYDNDGDPDIFVIGSEEFPAGELGRIYRNEGGGFVDIGAGLPGLYWVDAAWGDCDNDGDLDLLLTGGDSNASGDQKTSRIYRNDGDGDFVRLDVGLQPVVLGESAWGDYDNDGDLDILLTGETMPQGPDTQITKLYRNDGDEVFVDIGAGLEGVSHSTVDWGDYDDDGDLDILLAGYPAVGGQFAGVYRNDAGSFVDIAAGLEPNGNGGGGWGDYDNDGDLDILLTGEAPGTLSRLYRNDGGGAFIDVGTTLPSVRYGDAAWVDFDNDSDLDVLLSGERGNTSLPWISDLYKNTGAPTNSVPSAPSNLTHTVTPTEVIFSWDASSDAETPAAGLSYNIRVGTTPGGSEIASAMSDASNGFRKVVEKGNAQLGTSWRLKLPPGTYYWSVQAVDHSYAGSPFAPEQSFRVVRFTTAAAGLPALTGSAVAPADFDLDGDLDLAVAGTPEASAPVARLYRNEGGATFVDLIAGLEGVDTGDVEWSDFDNDGDADLLVTGANASGEISTLYRNDGGVFVDAGIGLPGLYWSAAAWGDCDNDGDPDLLLTGGQPSSPSDEIVSRIYRNEGDGTFVDLAAGLTGVVLGAVAWGDYDGDDDLDILITGETDPYGTDTPIARVYRNDGGTFVDVSAGLDGVSHSVADWGDFDDDGDLDILLSGYPLGGSGLQSRVYRNDGVAFPDVTSGLDDFGNGGGGWGDYDNDGDLDILLCGESPTGTSSRVYRNEGGATFIDVGAALPGVSNGDAAWGDFDGDADLDVVLLGEQGGPPFIANLSLVEGPPANTAPTPPTNLLDGVTPTTLHTFWSGAGDSETAPDGLSYNVRIGSTPGGADVVSPLADETTGQRRIVATGNAQSGPGWRVDLDPGTYYWSVQSIDHAFTGSAFGAERSITVVKLEDPDAGLTGLTLSAAAWADYDRDRDLDLLLTGSMTPEPTLTPWTRIYRNEGGTVFTELDMGMDGVAGGAVAWGKFNRDRRADVLLSGMTDSGLETSIYRNLGTSFTLESSPLQPVWRSAAAWADYDRDGREDLVLTGLTSGGQPQSVLYRRNQFWFTPMFPFETGFEPVSSGAVGWADVDRDRDLDLLIAGSSDSGPIARLYLNDDGSFAVAPASIVGLTNCALAWGDLDNDRDPDLVISGHDGTTRVTYVYDNDGPTQFQQHTTTMPGVEFGSIALGDYDNDGDLDVLLAGLADAGRTCDVYRNDGGLQFVPMNMGMPGISGGAVAWQDEDNDRDLDAFIAGESDAGPIAMIFHTVGPNPNQPPNPFGGLVARGAPALRRGEHSPQAGTPSTESVGVPLYELTLGWAPGSDLETPTNGLTYNLRVGTTPDGDDIMTALSDPVTGDLFVAAAGNVRQETSWTLLVPEGIYYWSVQSVDGAFAGSLFSPEQVIAVPEWADASAGLLADPGAGDGVAMGDIDLDGDHDLYVGNDGANVMLRNEGGGVFVDATTGLLGDGGDAEGVAFADIDNDGDLDLYVANFDGANKIFRNEGAGSFADLATSPLSHPGASEGVAFGDIDNDGDLDLYVVNFSGQANTLFRNEGGGTFVDATDAVLGDTGSGVATSFADVDDDGDLDLYLANFGAPNKLFRNDGNGIFVDLTQGPLGDAGDGAGVAFGDIDNDGDLDLYLANFGQANRLMRNEGGGSFVDVTSAPLDDIHTGTGVAFGDVDNDGDLDLYLANTSGGTNRLYRNEGGGSFVDATLAPLDDSGAGRGVALGDVDDDGDLDIYLVNFAESNKLFRNAGAAVGNRWLHVDLVGTLSNRFGVGARVRVVAGGVTQVREIRAGSGYLSQSSLTAEFGLGAAAQVDSIVVRWPNGFVQDTSDVEVDQRLTILDYSVLVDVAPDRPSRVLLHASVPNPFNRSTLIRFDLPHASKVSLDVLDVRGRRVRALESRWREAGRHEVQWNGRSDSGREVPSGIYFYVLETGAIRAVGRTAVIR